MTGAKQRIDNFHGNEQEYVTYLEEQVSVLRQQQSGSNLALRTEGPARSNLVALSRRPDEELQLSDVLEVRPLNHPAKRSKTYLPAWKRHAAGLVKRTPLAVDWWSALRSQGIYEVMCNGMAVAFLLGDESSPPVAQGATIEANLSGDDFALLRHIAHYAHATSRRRLTASVAMRLANFQQILVLSTCAVIRSIARPSVPDEPLLDVVKICLGDVSNEYCFRMLDTAIFVNRLIDVLNAHGWDGRAAELLLWC